MGSYPSVSRRTDAGSAETLSFAAFLCAYFSAELPFRGKGD